MAKYSRRGVNPEAVRAIEGILRSHVREMCSRVGDLSEYGVDSVTLRYGDLVSRSGIGIANGQKPYLDAIADICRNNGEPSIDCFVVNARTGRPGAGFRGDGREWEVQVRACLRHASKLASVSS